MPRQRLLASAGPGEAALPLGVERPTDSSAAAAPDGPRRRGVHCHPDPMKSCHVYVNSPDHDFDKGLAAEAARVADESARSGFPMRVVMRYARGDERAQWQQLQEDRQATPLPDLVVVIPVNQDAVYDILYEIVNSRQDVTCVFLHQSLTKMLATERADYKTRLFSVAADQDEIGHLQAQQLAALLPGRQGDVLYVQGEEHSFGTRHRMKGLLVGLRETPSLKLNGYRIFGNWSPESVEPAVDRWIASGGQLKWIDAAGAQNDEMALALADLLRARGYPVPVIGVDGLDKGRRAVEQGRLAATVIQPLGVGHAMSVFRDLITGALTPASLPDTGNIVLAPESFPPLDVLRRRAG
jgi:ABC-type sugar transport system substrate-binding protein